MGTPSNRGAKIRLAADRAAVGLEAHFASSSPDVAARTPLMSADSFCYFDRVFVLNLDSEVDRLARMTARLERLGIAFERIAAIEPRGDEPYDPSKPNLRPGRVAAARSHRAILERAMKAEHARVLVLEDDVVFRDDTADWLNRALPQLNGVPWDVFYFGLHLIEDGGSLTENLGKVGLGFQSHAYAVTRRAMPLLIEAIDDSIESGFDFDGYEHPNLLKVYAKSILAVQEPSASNRSDGSGNLGQYFPPFDRREFFEHCLEARSWKIDSQAGADRSVAELVDQAKRLHRSGKPSEAEAAYRNAVAMEPQNGEALHYLGLLKHQQGQTAAAIELMSRALALQPDCPEFHCNLGGILAAETDRAEEGMELLARAIELRPDYTEAYASLGSALERAGRTEDALAAWSRAIELRPTFAEAHRGMGNCLLRGSDFQRAVEHLREAVRLSRHNAPAHNDLGCALRKLGDLEGALGAFRSAAHLRPAMAEAQANLGTALSDLGRPDEAIPYLEKAIELRPDYANAHWSLSLVLLACGHFDRGWLAYEWRRHTEKDESQKRVFMEPAWNGCGIAGRTILVTCEQGMGDTLQFVRYLPLLKARGARVIFECQPTLREVLRGARGIDQLVARGEPLPRFDTHSRLLSLPGTFGTRLGNVPNEVPYLEPDSRREAEWKMRLAGQTGFKVGIAWQGSPMFYNDRTRSVPLANFEPLARVDGVRLISLQRNTGTEQLEEVAGTFGVEVPDPPLDEGTGAFMDTAAMMRNLDLVVTSDTAIAHLAGALGVRVWLAASFNCEWRWMRDREDSPWYPTMRLFRQRTLGDWSDVFSRMAAALRDTLAAVPSDEPPRVLAPMAPGELIDRLTILQIKSQRVSDPAKLRSVRTELDQLSAVRDRALPVSEQLDELARELRQVNEALWQIEDDIRAADAAEDFGSRFVELAQSVYRTNDRRAELKRRINALLGSAIRDEKHYVPYRR